VTITDFLLARIAEDEQRILGPGTDFAFEDTDDPNTIKVRSVPRPETPYIVRQRRDCEAKRRIVERSEFLVSEGAYPDLTRRERSWTDATLCILAAIYADHPDYDPEWAATDG
jgi:hypothetical protein